MAIDIERALVDPEYRKTLTPEELAKLPKRPVSLDAEELEGVTGGSPYDIATGHTSKS